jgi:hypothetical protein
VTFLEDSARYVECMGAGLSSVDARSGLSERDWWILLKRNPYLSELLTTNRRLDAPIEYIDLAARVQRAASEMAIVEPMTLLRGAHAPIADVARYQVGARIALDRLTFVTPDLEYARFFTFPKNAAGDFFPRPAGHVGLLFEYHGVTGQRGALVPSRLTRHPVRRAELVLPVGSVYTVTAAPQRDREGIHRVQLQANDTGRGLPAIRAPRLKDGPRRVLTGVWSELQQQAAALETR